MNRKCAIHWTSRASGITLVEALAGSLLLGTLLVSILVAKGQLMVQARRADDCLAACQVMDELVESWWPTLSDMPRQGSGEVDGHAGWKWQTRLVACEEADVLSAEVVAIEVTPPGRAAPAARLEILVPLSEGVDEKTSGTHSG
jgi:hypothetical protein